MSIQSDPVARVYAMALVEIGRETRTLPLIYDELVAVRRLSEQDRWFQAFFESPRIDRDVKRAAVTKAFAGKVSRPIEGLLRALIDRGRESLLDNIVDQFGKYKDLAENRVHAHVTVARPLPEDLRGELVSRLARHTGKNVELHEHVDPAALGGLALRIGDRVIDRTLRTSLAALRRRLLQAN